MHIKQNCTEITHVNKSEENSKKILIFCLFCHALMWENDTLTGVISNKYIKLKPKSNFPLHIFLWNQA